MLVSCLKCTNLLLLVAMVMCSSHSAAQVSSTCYLHRHMCNQYCCLTADVGVTEHSNIETASTDLFMIGRWVCAACMMDHSFTQGMDWNSDDACEGHSLIEAAAGSVTLRGLLYALMQPAPRRFLSLKSPALFAFSKAAVLNRAELQRMCWASNRSVGPLI